MLVLVVFGKQQQTRQGQHVDRRSPSRVVVAAVAVVDFDLFVVLVKLEMCVEDFEFRVEREFRREQCVCVCFG